MIRSAGHQCGDFSGAGELSLKMVLIFLSFKKFAGRRQGQMESNKQINNQTEEEKFFKW